MFAPKHKSLRLWGALALTLAIGVGAALPARANGVRIVDRPALASFGTIQAAVDAAIDGEVLLVGAGNYSAFTVVNKSVAIIAAPNATVTIQGTIEIDDLGPVRWVVLVGVSVTGAAKLAPEQSDPALRLLHNLGHVQLDNCTLRGGPGSGLGPNVTYGSGGHAALMLDNRRVSFARCNVLGGDGLGNTSGNSDTYGGNGGRAIDAQQSTVVLYDSSVTGGNGGPAGTQGGNGGDGYHELDFGVVASNTTFTGGRGGDGWDYVTNSGGDGGDGLFVDAGAQAHSLDSVYIRGAGGSSFLNLHPGVAGSPIDGTGNVTQHTGRARTVSAISVTDDETVWQVLVTGEPGDHVTLAYSAVPAFAVPNPVTGIQLVPSSSLAVHATAKVPLSGVLSMGVRVAPISGANPARLLFWQGWVDDFTGTRWLATPVHRLALDKRGLPDCNANGHIDLLDATQGVSVDLDHDLLPDTCDPDCNANGVIDGLDIASGTSADINHNLVPDSCEPTRTWYVNPSAPQGGDGSAGSPLRSLRAAIELTLPADTVVASDGLYFGPDNRELDFHGRNITVKSANGPANCIIDCESEARAFYLHTNETLGCVIDGFTITNGYANRVSFQFPSNYGGGILAYDAAPKVRNCVITACVALVQGGGLWLEGGRVENCLISSNTAVPAYGTGGGLFCGGNVVVVGCRLEHNQAQYGGGVAIGQLVAPGVALSRCSIVDNAAAVQGGGVFDNSAGTSLVLIDQCAFVGNSADQGGGIATTAYTSLLPASSIEIHNTTLAGNSAIHAGGALYLSLKKVGSISNSIAWGNSAALGSAMRIASATSQVSIDWCDVEGGLASLSWAPGTLNYGATNIALDPLFVDSACHVGAFSPCIDAGDNFSIALDRADSDGDGNINEPAPLDLDHNPRRVDDPGVPDTGNGSAPIVDLGCYERP